MSDWKTYQLGDICNDVAMGPFGSNLKIDNFISKGVPVIRGMNLHEGGFNKKNFAFVSEEKANSLKRCLAYPDDLVFTHRGTLGQVAIIPKIGFEKYLVSQSQMRLTVNRDFLNPKYLYYFFKSPLGQKELLKNTSQVGVPAIANPTKSLRQVEITIPDLSTQQEITQILTSIDDKIELNLQMNQTLEAMAKTLFKEWFINFNFPNFDGVLENGLPKRWRTEKLAAVCEIKYGKDHKHLEDGNIPVYGSGGIMRFVNKALYEKESILIPRKGTLTNLFYVSKPFWSVDTMFYTIIKDDAIRKYLFYLLKTLNLASMNVGSAVPSLTKEVLNKINIIIPENSILVEFEKIISSFYCKMEENNCQIEYLTKTRDTTLPKLISGKLKIK